jgi:uncharacterized membrane protein YidH (DUF202 family)
MACMWVSCGRAYRGWMLLRCGLGSSDNINLQLTNIVATEDLDESARQLESGSHQFQRGAKQVKRNECLKSAKLTVMLAMIVVAVVVVIVVAVA